MQGWQNPERELIGVAQSKQAALTGVLNIVMSFVILQNFENRKPRAIFLEYSSEIGLERRTGSDN